MYAESRVDDEFVNVFSAVNVFAVYVFGMVVEEWMYELTFVSPYAPPPPTQTSLIAKHPLVMLNPTLDVDVAKPEMFRPDSVVVPKPEPEIENADVDVVDRPSTDVVDR